MNVSESLWNARLIMVERATPQAQACAQWYARLLGDGLLEVAPGSYLIAAHDRATLISTGETKTAPSIAFEFADTAQWARYRDALVLNARDALTDVPTHICAALGGQAYALRDPDGRALVFATDCNLPSTPAKLPARLQHFVCASTQTPEMLRFYRDALGFIESDRVVDASGDLSSAFVRSNAEHHSFAVFRAPASGPDHHAYEVPDWNAIRDWADHCGDLEIPLWWGPGRHGVGNNLFFMIEDPDGYKVEFSAELEHMTFEQAYRTWPHGQRALNLWGNAWMRS
jgi:catechol 2,3-dioxygenase-like lactoylglutathione lyase family enzyme